MMGTASKALRLETMKTLTKLSGLIAVALVSAGTAQAAMYTETYNGAFANGGVIPDGSTTGW